MELKQLHVNCEEMKDGKDWESFINYFVNIDKPTLLMVHPKGENLHFTPISNIFMDKLLAEEENDNVSANQILWFGCLHSYFTLVQIGKITLSQAAQLLELDSYECLKIYAIWITSIGQYNLEKGHVNKEET